MQLTFLQRNGIQNWLSKGLSRKYLMGEEAWLRFENRDSWCRWFGKSLTISTVPATITAKKQKSRPGKPRSLRATRRVKRGFGWLETHASIDLLCKIIIPVVYTTKEICNSSVGLGKEYTAHICCSKSCQEVECRLANLYFVLRFARFERAATSYSLLVQANLVVLYTPVVWALQSEPNSMAGDRPKVDFLSKSSLPLQILLFFNNVWAVRWTLFFYPASHGNLWITKNFVGVQVLWFLIMLGLFIWKAAALPYPTGK